MNFSKVKILPQQDELYEQMPREWYYKIVEVVTWYSGGRIRIKFEDGLETDLHAEDYEIIS